MTREEVILRRIKLKRQLISLLYDDISLLQDEYESIGDVMGKFARKESALRDEYREEEWHDKGA